MTDKPKPVLIVTRPEADAGRFVDAVRKACPTEFDDIVAPLLEIVHLPVTAPDRDVAHLVLTSVNGVQAADRLGINRTAIAWCVGPRTADAAKTLGFQTKMAAGAGQELLQAMIAADLAGSILYLRGKHARVEIAKGLSKAGHPCTDLVAYDQIAIALTDKANTALMGQIAPILPLFSARTAEILRGEIATNARMHVVAMSTAIKDAFGNNGVLSAQVAQVPTEPAMIAETVVAIVAQGNAMQP